jgi:hypothetical protein
MINATTAQTADLPDLLIFLNLRIKKYIALNGIHHASKGRVFQLLSDEIARAGTSPCRYCSKFGG